LEIREEVFKISPRDLVKRIKLIKSATKKSTIRVISELAKNSVKSKLFPKRLDRVPMPDTTIYDYIYRCGQNRLDEVVFNYGTAEITVREFFLRVEDVANAIKKYGVKEGEYVGISMPTSPEALIELFCELVIIYILIFLRILYTNRKCQTI